VEARVLRVLDTAGWIGVAALALVNARHGEWEIVTTGGMLAVMIAAMVATLGVTERR
jgi:hypothetical protein